MAQNLIVGLIVVAAALYSAWMFMPAAVRRAAAARLASLAHRCGLGEQDTERLRTSLATHSSCGECDSCKGCAIAATRTTRVDLPRPGGNAQIGRPGSN